MLNGRHDAMFPIDLVLKDLGYARSLDRSQGEHVPLVGSTVARFERAQRQGLGQRNITAVDLLNRA
jgi:3-hydroxyisobutyrate dehydrogenase-like beta-hydroxyacid dehydrogenase